MIPATLHYWIRNWLVPRHEGQALPYHLPDFQTQTQLFSALTDPRVVPAREFVGLIRELIAARPAAERESIRHGVGVEILQALGMGMDGITLQHPHDNAVGNPDQAGDQRTFFVYPYPRFTVGASVAPICHDEAGAIYLLLVRDKVKMANGQLLDQPQPHWNLSGGFMNACDPTTHDPARTRGKPANPGFPHRHYDPNVQAAALRELEEETGLKPDSSLPLEFLNLRSTYRADRHHISVGYLLNYGLQPTPPKATPQHETYDARWVPVRDLTRDANGTLQATVDGQTLPVFSRHEKAVGLAVAKAREAIKPGFYCAADVFSPEAAEAFAHFTPQPCIAATTARHDGTANPLTPPARAV